MTENDKNRSEILNGISIFVEVGQSENFTVAARKLNITASGVSRAISRLEARLGTLLVVRTTRSIHLTSEGEIYFERCRQIINDLAEAELELSEYRDEPAGRLRVRLPRSFGRAVVIPALEGFTRRFPKIKLDIRLMSGVVDSIEQGIDVGMQLGKPREARLIARQLHPVKYVLCAAPEYLKKYGVPKTVADLTSHRCLTYIQPFTSTYREWTLMVDRKPTSFKAAGDVNIDDVLGILDAAISGVGIAYVMDFAIWRPVADGKLRIVMPDHAFEGPSAYVVYPPERARSPRVRAFVDFLLGLVPQSGKIDDY
jgi:LysR family transcriptional regulator, regulator for bpeEF and oprC